MGYALWLVPAQPHFGMLQQTMRFRPPFYNPTTHTARSYACFDPHITLAAFSSSFSTPFPLGALLPPKALKPIPIHFRSLKTGGSYLGSLSIAVDKSQELMELREAIIQHLDGLQGVETKIQTHPHMSLFYLDETFPDERHALAEELKRTQRIIENGDMGLELRIPDSTGAHSMQGFQGQEIWLVNTTSSVARWKVLEKRSLAIPTHAGRFFESLDDSGNRVRRGSAGRSDGAIVYPVAGGAEPTPEVLRVQNTIYWDKREIQGRSRSSNRAKLHKQKKVERRIARGGGKYWSCWWIRRLIPCSRPSV